MNRSFTHSRYSYNNKSHSPTLSTSSSALSSAFSSVLSSAFNSALSSAFNSALSSAFTSAFHTSFSRQLSNIQIPEPVQLSFFAVMLDANETRRVRVVVELGNFDAV